MRIPIAGLLLALPLAQAAQHQAPFGKADALESSSASDKSTSAIKSSHTSIHSPKHNLHHSAAASSTKGSKASSKDSSKSDSKDETKEDSKDDSKDSTKDDTAKDSSKDDTKKSSHKGHTVLEKLDEASVFPQITNTDDKARKHMEHVAENQISHNAKMSEEQKTPDDSIPIKNSPAFGDDALPYSPPFYPSPLVKGTGDWKTAVSKAKKYIKTFNLQEKVDLVTGMGWAASVCVGNIKPLPRVGFPGLCLEDSPLGVRFADLVSVFPSGLTTAATFSSDLAYKRGVAMGEEHRAKGVNIQLGPGMNGHRVAAGGRNWEMNGADPYLSGEAAYQTIKGTQSTGVQANAKHYLANEQEHYRNQYSSNIDGRTEREIYDHPFLRSIQAGVGSVMASYNLINNSWAAQNSELLNNRLKTEMKFQGFVMSDWGATHSGVSAANAGLDMTMPGDIICCNAGGNAKSSFFGGNMTKAINNGSVEMERLDDMGTRILAAWYKMGQDDPDYPKPNFNAFDINDPATNQHVEATQDHHKIIREIGAAGTVLLKNKKHALPLNKPKKIAIIGEDAAPGRGGPNRFGDRGGNDDGVDGTLGIGWGSGTADYSYLISPYEALQARARKDRTGVNWSFLNYDYNQAKTVATGADAALVFIYSDSGEGYITVAGNEGDRNNLTAWEGGNKLVEQVASVNKNTMVIMHAPGQMDIESFVNNENVTAIIWAGMPGAESGNAITDVLYGEYNPSGRLPFTMAKKRSDYGVDVTYIDTTGTGYPQINYTEGLFVDYRHFDHNNIEPRYPFGHGLSYTSFKYSSASGKWLGKADWNGMWGNKQASDGLPDWLFEPIYEVSFKVQNTGKIDGHEVPQVYLSFPKSAGEPPKVLRKFDRFFIKAGAEKTIKFQLNRYDMSIFDSDHQRWLKPHGSTHFRIGASSRDIRESFKVNQ